MTDEKSRLRQEVLAKRDGLPVANRVIHSATILQKLFELQPMRSARWVNFYVSYGSEVETPGMISHALSHGKRVTVPKVMREGSLILSEVTHPVRELAPGFRGIPEPRPEYIRPVPIEEMDLFIVPGIAFDRGGGRLGQGAGYYDRLLGRAVGKVPIVALAFECQMVLNLPVSSHDVKMDFIVTEKKLVECTRK